MKTLNLITVASILQKKGERSLRNEHEELFATLDANFAVTIYYLNDLSVSQIQNLFNQDAVTVLFVATGGTEGIVVRRYADIPKPITILTDGKANSLAATLELACWIRQQKDQCHIIHGDMQHVVAELNNIRMDSSTTPLLNGERIGVVGTPSDWLVSSDVDYAAAKNRWGVEYVDIALDEVERYFAEETDADIETVDTFMNNASGCVEPNRDEVVKAVRLYRALERVAKEHQLTALTLQCFSLIPTTKTTGCLALALLNDNGIVAGCEGDLQSIFTMLLAKRATGVDGFMANPARIDITNNQIILAHCTIGLKQTQSYIIRSHFESQSGVAIQGILPTGDITIVKCGGTDLGDSIVLTGKILENQNDPYKCRTQLLLQLDENSPVTYFLERNIGNHHIILQGNHREALKKVLCC